MFVGLLFFCDRNCETKNNSIFAHSVQYDDFYYIHINTDGVQLDRKNQFMFCIGSFSLGSLLLK